MEQQKEGVRQEFMLLNWYLKEHLASAVRIAAFIGVFSLLCFLRNVPQDVTVYMIVLMAAAGAAGFCFHYGKYRKHHLVLALLAAEPQGKTGALPEADGLLARDYQQIIASYERQFQEEQIKMEQKYRDMMEYYTMWTHQIKTPIAAMRLLLQEEDTPLSREMQSELFQTEQYVQMALQYLRMEKMTSDLVFARYDLDALIRQAVRKYAPLFIRRKIILSYEPVHCEVLTDEKWLVFVLEQILSNALKYTKSGSIHIYLSPNAPKTLVIEEPASALRRRICRGFSKKATRAATAAQTSGQRASDCICAARSWRNFRIPSALSRRWEWERRCILGWIPYPCST